MDWANVADEIEDVGVGQLHAGRSRRTPALIHLLKAEAWPTVREAPNWRAKVIRFRGEAADRFSPAMRQRIDMGRLSRRALRALPETMDGLQPLPVPEVCPVTLDELLSDGS